MEKITRSMIPHVISRNRDTFALNFTSNLYISMSKPPIMGPNPSPIAYDALKTAEISPKRLIDSAYLLL